ncbi:LutC/YkgG family protein [Sphingomonas desiccabilis]|uniref:LUD domain-containing protein n=1 Tax=Sphingomonas desiccabilis TaxID=429134 RepID=A0A4Q2IL58_9SPHN|nr:LUD domain-containing protein [Sphingomonas desiccabilis]MBB3912665.1 L-lactate dehydrogenase complex protein LldG [Sphingomonas desiccabilis]RXZ29947.1 hypothetical protein EO081_16540 [Sphingomonas desiccabilis]
MSARDAILGRLEGSRPAGAIAREAAILANDPERPLLAHEALIPQFLAQLGLASVAATFEPVRDWSGIPAAAAAYLDATALPRSIYLPPDPRLRACDWSGIALRETCAPDKAAAVGRAIAGVAETGSLIFETGPATPMLPNFLALHHVVVVEARTIVAHLEDIPARLREARAHYWVTGVSGTTDIEGQYVRGAHGPRYLHVLLVDEAP